MIIRLLDQHQYLSLTDGIAVDAIEVSNLGRVCLVTRPAFVFEVDRCRARRLKELGADQASARAGDRQAQQVAPNKLSLERHSHRSRFQVETTSSLSDTRPSRNRCGRFYRFKTVRAQLTAILLNLQQFLCRSASGVTPAALLHAQSKKHSRHDHFDTEKDMCSLHRNQS
jgi:hypothetical protein